MMMKKWVSLLLSFLMVLCLGPAVMAEENPVGMMEGSLYVNEPLGFCVVLPNGWNFHSDADLANQMGYDSQYASREGLAALLQQESFVCAMIASAASDPAWTMNLVVAELGMYRYLDEKTLLTLSEESCIEAVKAQGISNVQLTESVFQLAGAEHAGAVLTGNVGAYQMYMIVVLVKGERYMGSLTVTASSQEKAESTLDFFKPIVGTTHVSTGGDSDSGAKKVHAQIDDALARKDWAGALTLLKGQYGNSYPDYANAVKNCQNHLDYNEAKQAMDKKLYYTAYQLFSSLGSFEDASEMARLCLRPTPNSGELSRNAAYSRTAVRLNLTNGLSDHYYVYLRAYDSTGNIIVSTCFIQPGKTVSIYLPDDTFLFKAAFGKGPWFGEEEMFGDESFYKEMFTQSLEKTGGGYYYLTFDDILAYDAIDREDF